jgi:FMN phosphatase YigB (HAD superfamily)
MAPAVRDALFDLDGCLYPIGIGLEEHVRERIFAFMVERLGVSDAALARELWHIAFRRFNQSLRGLRACGYAFDADEYWRFIRGDSCRFLTPAPQVQALLRSLNDAGVRCWVFTNCREQEAVEALRALDLDPSLFRGVLGADFQARSTDRLRLASGEKGQSWAPVRARGRGCGLNRRCRLVRVCVHASCVMRRARAATG